MAKFVSLALTNAVDGREQEFNDWHTNQHVFDVLAIAKAKSVQRSRQSDVGRGPPPHRCLAIHDLEADDLTGNLAKIRRCAGTHLMPRNDVMSANQPFLDCDPVSPAITVKDKAKRSQA